MRRPLPMVLIVTALCLAVFGLWFGVAVWELKQLDARYRQVQRGMSTNDVVSIMGADGVWKEKYFRAWWDEERLGDAQDARICRGVRYSVQLWYLPVTFEFTFDADGRTIGRHRHD